MGTLAFPLVECFLRTDKIKNDEGDEVRGYDEDDNGHDGHGILHVVMELLQETLHIYTHYNLMANTFPQVLKTVLPFPFPSGDNLSFRRCQICWAELSQPFRKKKEVVF